MSEDVSTPIPDEPGQDPDAALQEPVTDGYGLSGTPDSGYDLGDGGAARDAHDVEIAGPAGRGNDDLVTLIQAGHHPVEPQKLNTPSSSL